LTEVSKWINLRRGGTNYRVWPKDITEPNNCGCCPLDVVKRWSLPQCQKCLSKSSDQKGVRLVMVKEGEFQCEQCLLFEELDIMNENQLTFSEDQFNHLASALLPSPITWLWIPALGDSPMYMLLMFFVNGGIVLALLFLDMFSTADFEGPFRVMKRANFRALHVIQYLVNLFFFGELFRQYGILNNGNVVYHCHWDNLADDNEDPPDECFVYLDLLGSSFVVYFCSIFVNVSCIRTMKMDSAYRTCCTLSCKHCTDTSPDDKDAKCSDSKDDRHVCADAWLCGRFMAQSVPHSSATLLTMLNNGKNGSPERGSPERVIWKSLKLALYDLHLLGKQNITTVGFSCRWLNLNCFKNKPWNNSRKESASYARKLLLFALVWIFTGALTFSSAFVYGGAFFRSITSGGELWWIKLAVVATTSILSGVVVHMFCSTLYNITSIFHKACAAMRVCEDFKYLLYDSEIPMIDALKTWYDLRCYVVSEVLPCFHEVTNPILSLLVSAVLFFTFAWIYQLLGLFEAKPSVFFESILMDNVRFVAFGFTLFLIMATMMVLEWVLQPYARQSVHIDILKGKKTELMFLYKKECIETVEKLARSKAASNIKGPVSVDLEDLNPEDNSELFRGDFSKSMSLKMKKYQSFMDIYDHLINDMEEFKSAPQVLGMDLTESKLTAIRGYILSVVALFVGTVFGDYVKEYDGLLNG